MQCDRMHEIMRQSSFSSLSEGDKDDDDVVWSSLVEPEIDLDG